MKAVTAAQLAMASDTVYRVSLDQAIEAMRLTAADMSVKYKETSLSVRPPWALGFEGCRWAPPPRRVQCTDGKFVSFSSRVWR